MGWPLLVAANAVMLVTIAFRPLPLIDNLTIPDDAYLSLHLARNIARGLGPLYGLAPTNGFQPLYVFLMVPAFWVWPTDPEPPVRAALLLLSVFNLATLVVLLRWIRRLTGSAIVALLAGLAWTFNFYVVYVTLNGLETAVSAFFVVACLALFHHLVAGDDLPARGAFGLGLLLGAAVFARIDNAILAAVLGGVLLLRFRARPGWLQSVLLLGAGVVLVNLPWWSWSLHLTGTIFPTSGPAVRFRSLANVSHAPTLANFYVPMFQKALVAVWQKNTELLCGTGALLLLGRILGPFAPAPRWLLLALVLYAASMIGAYATYVVAPWYFSRYLFPLLFVLLALFAIAQQHLLTRFRDHRWMWPVMLLPGLLVVGAQIARPQFGRLFASTETRAFGYMNVGLWAKEHFPPGTRLGSAQTGGLAYFAPELTVVNLDGVVNRAGLDALRERRAMEYVRGAGIEYLVNWERDVQFLLAHSPPEEVENLRDLGPITEFRSWNNVWHVYEVRLDLAGK